MTIYLQLTLALCIKAAVSHKQLIQFVLSAEPEVVLQGCYFVLMSSQMIQAIAGKRMYVLACHILVL